MNIRGDGVSAFPAKAGRSTGHAVVSPPKIKASAIWTVVVDGPNKADANRAGSSAKERRRRKPVEARGSSPLLPTNILAINIRGGSVKRTPGYNPEVCGSRRSPRTMGT